MSIQAVTPWGIESLQSTRPLQPLTQILSMKITNTLSEACFFRVSLFLPIEPGGLDVDMQSRCFDICLTVNIHALQNAVCPALHECFLPAQWRCHTGTCGKLQLHSPTLETPEDTGESPSLIHNNASPSPRLLWSALLWVPPVCDDNESRKEGNDFVSD